MFGFIQDIFCARRAANYKELGDPDKESAESSLTFSGKRVNPVNHQGMLLILSQGLLDINDNPIEGEGVISAEFIANKDCNMPNNPRDGKLYNILDQGNFKKISNTHSGKKYEALVLTKGKKYLYVREESEGEDKKKLLQVSKGTFINNALHGENCSATHYTNAANFGISSFLPNPKNDNVAKVILRGVFNGGQHISGDIILYDNNDKVICKISAKLFTKENGNFKFHNGTKISYYEKDGVRKITTETKIYPQKKTILATVDESEEHKKTREDLENELIKQQESELRAKMQIEEKRLFNQMRARQEKLWQIYIAREREKDETKMKVIGNDDSSLDPKQKILQEICAKITDIRNSIPQKDYSESLNKLNKLNTELEEKEIPDIEKSILSADILFQQALIKKDKYILHLIFKKNSNFIEKRVNYLMKHLINLILQIKILLNLTILQKIYLLALYCNNPEFYIQNI